MSFQLPVLEMPLGLCPSPPPPPAPPFPRPCSTPPGDSFHLLAGGPTCLGQIGLRHRQQRQAASVLPQSPGLECPDTCSTPGLRGDMGPAKATVISARLESIYQDMHNRAVRGLEPGLPVSGSEYQREERSGLTNSCPSGRPDEDEKPTPSRYNVSVASVASVGTTRSLDYLDPAASPLLTALRNRMFCTGPTNSDSPAGCPASWQQTSERVAAVDGQFFGITSPAGHFIRAPRDSDAGCELQPTLSDDLCPTVHKRHLFTPIGGSLDRSVMLQLRQQHAWRTNQEKGQLPGLRASVKSLANLDRDRILCPDDEVTSQKRHVDEAKRAPALPYSAGASDSRCLSRTRPSHGFGGDRRMSQLYSRITSAQCSQLSASYGQTKRPTRASSATTSRALSTTGIVTRSAESSQSLAGPTTPEACLAGLGKGETGSFLSRATSEKMVNSPVTSRVRLVKPALKRFTRFSSQDPANSANSEPNKRKGLLKTHTLPEPLGNRPFVQPGKSALAKTTSQQGPGEKGRPAGDGLEGRETG
ncbi:unnamed protein product [Protopolystoma xenopodis]|uniref:Uncharacterized protein n=1 Tax=Protopolystoma xenopodis TaxID=117903 RepID=A0A3S5BPX5_9PLAT|nr:unnamed protein product [Protopolystoma xenopodis]